MKTVHMIGNAHMDPIWLWHKADGVDAVLATARSACDRIDEYKDFIFTCSASWFHKVVQQHDAALFERVRKCVQAGRWQIVGGTVVQPDCNLPDEVSFIKQFEQGNGYFRREFGRAATVGYNVDSFGHGAYLPRFLRRSGLDAYVFMRPVEREKPLASNLFRWRSPDGAEVLTYRIGWAYASWVDDIRRHIEHEVAHLPADAEHAMCFFGIGDHGGGPTRKQIEWIINNAGAIPGVRLVFSHPRAFFDAVAPRAAELPVVEGELQHHAVGCYAVERRVKTGVRRAERALVQAQECAAMFGEFKHVDFDAAAERAWEAVLFNEFHDVMGGTCLDAATRLAAGELVAAEAQARDLTTQITRSAFRKEAAPGTHKLVVVNSSGEAFDGYVEHEPWTDGWMVNKPSVYDEQGAPIAMQMVASRPKALNYANVLMRLQVPARSSRVLTVKWDEPLAVTQAQNEAAWTPPAPPAIIATDKLAVSGDGVSVNVADWSMELEVIEDTSDTWAHEVGNRFAGPKLGSFAWQGDWEAFEKGPIRTSVRQLARFGDSRAWCHLSLTRDEPFLRVRLAVTWAQVNQLLRMRLCCGAPISKRVDQVAGGPLVREADGKEYALNGSMAVQAGASSLAVVTPEVFSLSVDSASVYLTLLRAPYLAHTEPMPVGLRSDHPVADQGRHDFDIVLWPGAPVDLAVPSRMAREMLAPPVIFDVSG